MPPFRHAFITGASSGLGRGLALHYARTGATVYAAARRREALEALANEPGLEGAIVPLPLDVCDAEALSSAFREAEVAAGGAFDLVVANAGVSAVTSGRDIDWRAVKRVLEVNVTAACVTVALALPAMVARGAGTVAAVSSLAGFRGLPDNGAYCASKAALQTFMESLRVDLRGTGVRAVTINPGFVKTAMTVGNVFPMPFLMELPDAVSVIALGLDRGRAVLSFPLPLHALVRAISALPRVIYEPLARRGRDL